jgi:alanine racemase
MSRATQATIHLDALRHNLARVRQLAPHSRVMAVVKADGYGHGLERVARALEGADAFGVAAITDAERLRAAGFSQRIVLLSGFDEPADLPVLGRLGLESVLHHEEQLRILEAEGSRLSAPLRLWLKLDTGMHRLGFHPGRLAELRARLAALPMLAPEPVLMTHFARSDEFQAEATREQVARFEAAIAGLPGERSLANSAAVLGWPQAHADWIRPGGALYGISVVAGRTGADFGLHPAMTLSTRLIAINRVAEGEPVGYGGDWRAPADMAIGVAAIGYGDGYPRHAPPGTEVLVNGRPVPIAGRVSMDLMALDLRGLPEARVGDRVLLWGPELPIERVAEAAGTIGYELSCGLTRRVRFVESG